MSSLSSSSSSLPEETTPGEDEPQPQPQPQQRQSPIAKAKATPPAKVHTVTVCAVPPPENVRVWKALSEMRSALKDPGFYRWPPHVNLLYPFLKLQAPDPSKTKLKSEISSGGDAGVRSLPLPDVEPIDGSDSDNDIDNNLSKIVERLESSARTIDPFPVRLNKLGTFGGKKRGVLWLHPDSGNGTARKSENKEKNQNKHENESHPSSPMIALQKSLEEAFPVCREQSQNGGFTPHMTLSHFPSLDEALAAKETTESTWPFLRADGEVAVNSRGGEGDPERDDEPDRLEFLLDRIYLLERKGDDGQFLRVAEIALGERRDGGPAGGGSETRIFDPPSAFPGMPPREDEWVRRERMSLKSRRRRRSRGRGGARRKQGRARRGPRIPDTPEVIAEKRAQRKAKRERLLREQTEREA